MSLNNANIMCRLNCLEQSIVDMNFFTMTLLTSRLMGTETVNLRSLVAAHLGEQFSLLAEMESFTRQKLLNSRICL